MSGANRRGKRLKQGTALSDITEFSSVNPADGDLLIYDSVDGQYENSKALTGSYTLSGDLNLTDLVVTDDLTVQDALTVQGTATLSGALGVTGAATFNNTVAVAGTLTVTGAAILNDDLTVAGALTGAGFSFSGSGTVVGTLGVTGATTLTSATLSGALTVAGATQLDTLLVTDVAVFQAPATFDSTISAQAVAGTSLAGGSLAVDTADITALLTLGVGATANTLTPSATGITFSQAITITGALDHDGTNIGFFGTAPAAQAAAYTPTNVSTDRAYDADSTTLHEIADVLGTLIADLQTYGLIQ
jgi:hypothetical protein